ncbi:DNA oxidative demethylase AlkB [Uliginosibacterium sp. H3]|uniref:DNA oxidative demethylase AlkB n=1 Tax=Uliginosibacterium silvisoli TaxID=3114758 RepID=A0ABU6JZ68_9RHOO|nr:DNA oxidative demethylase AlkB [Uliginosibacterium sp. H3]
MTLGLFGSGDAQGWREELLPGAVVLRAFALADEAALLAAIDAVLKQAPFRHMQTPGGYTMSVAMSCCGDLGWVTDSTGYRYQRNDPLTGHAWPEMPVAFRRLAVRAADSAGFAGFQPDACLINRYEPGARMSLHQDKNERDFSAPIVSVSLGLPAVFLFGGMARSDKSLRVQLAHGDVVVWGAAARLRYHGVMPLAAGVHPLLGEQRINLTFRKAG